MGRLQPFENSLSIRVLMEWWCSIFAYLCLKASLLLLHFSMCGCADTPHLDVTFLRKLRVLNATRFACYQNVRGVDKTLENNIKKLFNSRCTTDELGSKVWSKKRLTVNKGKHESSTTTGSKLVYCSRNGCRSGSGLKADLLQH